MDVHQASGPFPVGVGNRNKSFPHAAYSVLVLKEGQNFERGNADRRTRRSTRYLFRAGGFWFALTTMGWKYSGTMTRVFGEAAFTSARKDCNLSMAGCCEVL